MQSAMPEPVVATTADATMSTADGASTPSGAEKRVKTEPIPASEEVLTDNGVSKIMADENMQDVTED